MGALLAAGLPWEAIRSHTPAQVASLLDGFIQFNNDRADAIKAAQASRGGG